MLLDVIGVHALVIWGGGGGRDDLPESFCSNVQFEKNLGIRITYCTRYIYGNLNAL